MASGARVEGAAWGGGRASGPVDADNEGQQTRILDAAGQVLCRFPVSLKNVRSTPDGRTWAGADANYVYILRLEDGTSHPPSVHIKPPVKADQEESGSNLFSGCPGWLLVLAYVAGLFGCFKVESWLGWILIAATAGAVVLKHYRGQTPAT